MNVKKILHFSIGPISSAILGIVTLPLVAWFFSAEDVGRLSMLQITISFSLLVFSLGLDQAYVREFHEVEDRPALLKAVILPGTLILLLTLFAFILSPWTVSEMLFGIDSTYLTILLVMGIIIAFQSRFLSLILRMQERGLAFSISQILPKILFLIFIVFFIVFSVVPVFENLMLAYVVSLFAVLIVFSWNTREEWLSAVVARIDWQKLNYMLRYAIPLIGGGLAFWGLTATDRFFLRALSSFEELGVYSMALSFAGAGLVFQMIFSTVWAPVVYKWAAEGVEPKRIKQVMDYVTLAIVFIWSLAGLFSWLVTLILPPDYVQVQYILLAAMAYPLLYTLSEATGVGIGVTRRTFYSMLAAVLALSVNALGNYFLIPIYGAAGAAIASALAFMVFFTIKTEASSRLWFSFERLRMYILVLLLLALSIGVNVAAVNILISSVLWLGIMLFAILLYKKQVMNFTSMVSSWYVNKAK